MTQPMWHNATFLYSPQLMYSTLIYIVVSAHVCRKVCLPQCSFPTPLNSWN